ncbi:CFEM domain-containing protein [Hirsutella rhossiliensis]|uniref:CFEM domain-containing protein n=1 Tax=Hirsutella rhossiliensis TaxID=111463 RepID=A0A9P8N7F9_9HYPO|nr:CFEM domain-containing protein [Hirsutella rhossiliensis]KAH0967154.1 CFEM domain-containing protein [Hirsutella rhossiliensis]
MMALAASLGAAKAQLDQIPKCARDCVSKSMTGSSLGGCKLADIACICKNDDFLNNIACCLADVCSKEDQDKTVQSAKQLCNASNVQVPDKVECKKGASASSPSTRSSSSSATGTAAAASSSSKAAAAPMLAGAGNLAGALLAVAAAL